MKLRPKLEQQPLRAYFKLKAASKASNADCDSTRQQAALSERNEEIEIKQATQCDELTTERTRCPSEPTSSGSEENNATVNGVADMAHGNKTAYELQREANILRNRQRMVELGLAKAVKALKEAVQPSHKSPSSTKRKKSCRPVGEEKVVKRYPLRSRGAVEGGTAEAAAPPADVDDESEDSEEEPMLDRMEESNVYKYSCRNTEASTLTPDEWESKCVPGGYRLLPFSLVDSRLQRIYTLAYTATLCAAAGKDGRLAVWGIASLGEQAAAAEGKEELQPLISCKLHRSWVSDVHFIPQLEGSGAAARELLLSAGNDGCVCLWDINRAAVGKSGPEPKPMLLHEQADLHSAGIFASDTVASSGGGGGGVAVATASKDSTVAHSVLGEDGRVRLVHRFAELHDGVVKCVRWRDQHTFASCGNDRSICMQDVRTSRSCSGRVRGAHNSAVNFLQWHPEASAGSAPVVLSSSPDPVLRLHDLRSPAKPLLEMQGFAGAMRCPWIHQPCFVAGGAAVAAVSAPAQRLTVFSGETGKIVSWGSFDFSQCSTVAHLGAPGTAVARRALLALPASKAVHVMAPCKAHAP